MVKIIRREIRDLYKNNFEEFSRFIIALNNLMNSPDWFRICAIHGVAFLEGDKEIKCEVDSRKIEILMNNGEPVYCCHGDDRFLVWHRVYLNEFERMIQLYDKSNNLVPLALPYFNWFDVTNDIEIFNRDEIEILQEGQTIKVFNPLKSGKIYDSSSSSIYTANNGEYTTRNGELFTNRLNLGNFNTQVISLAKKSLSSPNYETLSSNSIFSQERDPTFSFKDFTQRNSLEISHNNFHMIAGGRGGSMSSVPTAPYDLIFWLHHNNVERLFCIWQKSILDSNRDVLSSQYILSEMMNKELPPFFSTGNNDLENPLKYKFGWTNNTGIYTKIKEWFDPKLLKYEYDNEKMPSTMKELINIKMHYVVLYCAPVPLESLEIDLYIAPKYIFENSKDNEDIFKDEYKAATYYWFGLNRKKKNCKRCQENYLNLSFNITDFVKKNDLIEKDFEDMVYRFIGKGLKDYPHEDIVGEGDIKLVFD